MISLVQEEHKCTALQLSEFVARKQMHAAVEEARVQGYALGRFVGIEETHETWKWAMREFLWTGSSQSSMKTWLKERLKPSPVIDHNYDWFNASVVSLIDGMSFHNLVGQVVERLAEDVENDL
jgi:hypothetical protein